MRPKLQRESFRALGTHCTVAACATRAELLRAREALAAARREVAACERTLSRFDPRSDLTRLNRAFGRWVAVDVRLIEALEAASRARIETDGRFDPTILPALAAAGYDRSFELVRERSPRPLDGWHAGAPIEVDPGSRSVRLEPGAAVDLGAIGKGFAATRAVRAMQVAWPAMSGAIVDLGGDIALFGLPPEGDDWLVDVEDPRTPGHKVATMRLSGGGVATSGSQARRFGPGRRLHHLIDPTSGLPAAAGPLSVTVVASSALEAEPHATALAVSDVDAARNYVAARPSIAALLIEETGPPIVLGELPLITETPRPRVVVTTPKGRFAWN